MSASDCRYPLAGNSSFDLLRLSQINPSRPPSPFEKRVSAYNTKPQAGFTSRTPQGKQEDGKVTRSSSVAKIVLKRQEAEPIKLSIKKEGQYQEIDSKNQKNIDRQVKKIQIPIVDLSSHKEMHPKPIQKSNGIGIQILMQLGNTWLGSFAMFKSACLLQWLGEPSVNTRSAIESQLNKMSSSLHLSKFLEGMAPWIAEVIKEKCLTLELSPLLKKFLIKEPQALPAFIAALLPHLYCNIANSIQISKGESQQHLSDCSTEDDLNFPSSTDTSAIMLADVVSLMCGMIHKHLPSIQQHVKSLDMIPDGKQKDKVIEEAFSGIVQEFLDVALPNGIKDLPLPVIPRFSQYFWEIIKKQIMPKIGYQLYLQITSPLQLKDQQELLQKNGGETLVSLAQLGGRQAAELLPSLLMPKTSGDSPVVAATIKSIQGLLSGSDQLKRWMEPWLRIQLHAFSSFKEPELKYLWKLFGRYCESLILHVFNHMSQQIPGIEVKEAMGVIFIQLLSGYSHFVNEKHEQIQKRLKDVILRKEDPKEDHELLHIFQPLADHLLHLMGLDQAAILPVPDFSKTLVVRQFKEMAPKFILEQYCAISNSNIDNREICEKLRTLLFDPKHLEESEVAVDVISTIYKNGELSQGAMFNEFYRNLWRASGTDELAATLEEICGKMASGLVDSSMKHLGISDQRQLQISHNPTMKAFDEQTKLMIKTALLESLVHLLGHVEVKAPQEPGTHPKAFTAFNALLQLHAMVSARLMGMSQDLSMIAKTYPEGSEAYMQEANKLFSGLASDIHGFIGVNPFKNFPLEGLPGGSSLKDVLWASTKSSLLPMLLHQAYRDLTKWESKTEAYYEELEQLYHTSHPKWACKVLAQYATDFIRHYLLNSSEDVAKLIIDGLGLQELKDNGEYFISQNIHAAAASEDPDFTTLWPAISKYAEAIFAKVFAGISKTIQNIEINNPDFTVDAAIQILKETADHFAVVAKVTEELGVDQAFQVPLADMLAAFGDRLHSGVPVKPSDPANVKDRVRLQGCFIPLAQKLLELANLSVRDFPIPSGLQKPVGELILNKIFPLVLMKCYQKACEPQVRNVLMLHFVQTLYAALNGVKPPKKDQELQEATPQLDPKKKQLYETCGSVVLELVKLIPDTAVQYVFMKEKVKNMSADAIGNAIMPILSRWSLLHMIDSAIYSGLPNFHPAKWEGKQGREDLIPRKISVRPDGKLELKAVKDFKFYFTQATNEITPYEQQKALEAAKVRRELRDGFTKTISQQLYEKLWAFIRSLWENMQGQLNDFVERMFSDKGREIKTVLDKVFRRIFFDVLGTIILFLTTPIIALTKLGIEKMIIDRRSENIIENLQTETLESLVYKWSDALFDALVRLHREPGRSS